MNENGKHEQALATTSVGDILLLEKLGYEIVMDIERGVISYEKKSPEQP